MLGWKFGARDAAGPGAERPESEARGGRGSPENVPVRVSLLGGCHADEPVGPRFLRHLVAWLSHRSQKALCRNEGPLDNVEWWIVPHANPDGEVRNRSWQEHGAPEYDVAAYLEGAVREAPGDDIEFGFPHGPEDHGARPENQAIYRWWSEAAGPFALHASLHGMGFAAGPWFLLEPAWLEPGSPKRAEPLIERMAARVGEAGYLLHDVDRGGEKGFTRVRRGFCTRPDSDAMKRYFLQSGDEETASRFRPSSMETVRRLAGERASPPGPLTLVSENPLFLTPGVGDDLGPPDPAAERWKDRIAGWRNALAQGHHPEAVRREAGEAGLRPMPTLDQMRLQWGLIVAGLELVTPD